MPKNGKSYLNPVRDLSDKNNFKRYFYIERDGKLIERIILETTNKSLREEIIFKHIVKALGFDEQNLKIVSRDNPWDFETLYDGDTFFVEITSIAENKWAFIKKSSEEKLRKIQEEPKVKIRDLKKISGKFSSMDLLNNFLKKNKDLQPNTEIDNPLYQSGSYIFLSDSKEPDGDYLDLIRKSILEKVGKKHNKEKVILVLDDRTISLSREELDVALKTITSEVGNLPFVSIFVYRGYYSNNDGTDAEFYLAQIK